MVNLQQRDTSARRPTRTGHRVLLPEWLCETASSAPLQTWLLHGDSSRECELVSQVCEEGISVLTECGDDLAAAAYSCLRCSSEGSPARKGLT